MNGRFLNKVGLTRSTTSRGAGGIGLPALEKGEKAMNAEKILILNDRCVRVYKDACVNYKVRETAIRFFQLALPHFAENDRAMARRNGLRLKTLMNLRFSRCPSWQVF